MFASVDTDRKKDREKDWQVQAFKCEAFKRVPYIPCFWCGFHLSRTMATADHINPDWRGGSSNSDNLEISCYDCNQKRCLVSSLGSRIRLVLQNKKRTSLSKRRAFLIRLLRERDEWLPLFLEIEKWYYDKLEGRRLRVCLNELDEILRAAL